MNEEQVKPEEQVKFYQCTERIISDIYDLAYKNNSFDLDAIEKIVVKNLRDGFSDLKIQRIIGRSIRTIRNNCGSRYV